MKKLVLVQWDIRMGPQIIVQFPPEPESIPKETLLKIWAKHEMVQDSNFITFSEDNSQINYCSLLKKEKVSNTTYLIILELDEEYDESIFQEILENIAENLISNVNLPHFSHILSDTYRMIKHFSDLDENQLFLHLYEDRVRLNIFSILRNGPISKHQLKLELEEKFGIKNRKIDILIAPFVRLELIVIKSVAGIPNSIFLQNDAYCCKFPPKRKSVNKNVQECIENIFTVPQIFKEEDLPRIVKLFQESGVKELFSLLFEESAEGMPIEIAQTIILNQMHVLDDLVKEKFLFIDESQNMIYPTAQLRFCKFKPKYLVPTLAKQYSKKSISFEQLLEQLKYIDFFERDIKINSDWNKIY